MRDRLERRHSDRVLHRSVVHLREPIFEERKGEHKDDIQMVDLTGRGGPYELHESPQVKRKDHFTVVVEADSRPLVVSREFSKESLLINRLLVGWQSVVAQRGVVTEKELGSSASLEPNTLYNRLQILAESLDKATSDDRRTFEPYLVALSQVTERVDVDTVKHLRDVFMTPEIWPPGTVK